MTSMTLALPERITRGGIRQIIPLQLPTDWLTETSKYYVGVGEFVCAPALLSWGINSTKKPKLQCVFPWETLIS